MKAMIKGVGLTKIDQHWSKSIGELAAEACFKALRDAGNPKIDAIVVGNMMSGLLNGQENLGAHIAESIGMSGIPAIKIEAACGSGGAAVMWGAIGVISGIFRNVLVVGVEKMTDATNTEDQSSALATASDAETELSMGATFAALNAIIMRRYMHEHGLSEEDFSHLPILMHKNAADVEHAQLRYRISLKDYLESPYVCEPLRLLDASPTGDGAAAMIIGKEGDVEIAGFGSSTDLVETFSRDLTELRAVKSAAKKAMEMASIELGDLDIVQIHDAFSVIGYMCVEAIGVVERGKAHKFFESGDAERNGYLPINPEGGLKARGHPVGATGVYQVAEIALQLMERAGPSQVEGARIGLSVNIGGTGSNVTAIVLKR
jgi:acetyl-CoA C-acetyltransferase